MSQQADADATPPETGRNAPTDAPGRGVQEVEQQLQQAESLLREALASASQEVVDWAGQLHWLREQASDRNQLLKGMAASFGEHYSPQLILFYRWGTAANGATAPQPFRLHGKLPDEETALVPDCEAVALEAMRGRRLIQDSCAAADGWLLSAAPIPQTRYECLVVLQRETASRQTDTLLALQAVALNVAYWDARRQDAETRSTLELVAATAELIGKLQSVARPQAAARELAEQLHRLFAERDVYVGLTQKGSPCRLVAVAGRLQVNRNSEETRRAEAAMHETLDRQAAGHWPPREESRHALLALKQFSEHLSGRPLQAYPLLDEQQEPQGVVLIADPPRQADEVAPERYMQLASRQMGSVLSLLARSRGGWLRRANERLLQLLKQRQGQVALAIVAVFVLALLIPFPYRVGCEVELQPVTRRFVAAPFAAPLQDTWVQPGELVTVGTELARLEGEELRIELARRLAELYQAEKERAGHLARGEIGEAELAKWEVQRLENHVQLLQRRLEQLTLTSPIDGVVVEGDWLDSTGVPLRQGESLFEIAPLDRILCELQVPQDEVRHIELGSQVKLRLEAYPDEVFVTRVARINPAARSYEQATVFVVESEIDNSSAQLRPGMSGRAKIEAGQRKLGWILFHRAADSLRMRWGW